MSYMVSGRDRKLTAEWLDEIVVVPDWLDEDVEDKFMDIAFSNNVNWKTLWVNTKNAKIIKYRTEVLRWMYSQPQYRDIRVISDHLGIPRQTVDRLIGKARPPVDPAANTRPSGVPSWVMDIVVDECAKHGVSMADIWGLVRFQEVRMCRYEIYKRVYESMHKPSLSTVGRWFRRDHTTISDAVRGLRRGKKDIKDIHSVRIADSGGGPDQHRQDAA